MAYKTETTMDFPVDTSLRPEIINLREIALRTPVHGVPTMAIIDAESWSEHTEGEDWLIWRARRVANRLRKMPIGILPGEQVVGRPDLRPPTQEESQEIQKAHEILKTMPPYPGGDSGHFHPDYEKLFRVGIRGIKKEIKERLESTDDEEKQNFYKACKIAIEGLSEYALRVGEKCRESAREDIENADHWNNLSRICEKVSSEPPTTFHEAIELMFIAEIALWFGEDHGLTTPGRMDQTLRPFYESDMASGQITREKALELISCLYIELNMILGLGSAVSVMVGGRDRNGNDVTNDLTYLCLLARLVTGLSYPTVGLAWHDGTPLELTDFSCRMLATGVGDPAFFNDELIAQGLRDNGVSEPDSYNYMNSTCVEIKVVGASNMWVTAPYFNCPQGLLEVMDMIADGRLSEPESFHDLNHLVKKRLAETVRGAAQSLHNTWMRRAETGCFPLASCLISDCLEKGQDFDRGGARYNWVENSFVGLANLADSLYAIKKLVYESEEMSLMEFRDIVRSDFKDHEDLRWRILNRIPKYGNNDDDIDSLAVEWAHFLEDTTESNIVGLHPYVPGFFCWVMHERMGSGTGATPDGRKAGFPLADGAGATQGREKCGPTASVLSTTKWDHKKAIGGLVHNVKFSKNALRTDEDFEALRNIIETFLRRGGFEIQVNVLSAETLRAAQEHPENYPDLLVRVAGYSDYFTHLNPNMQAEIIARTEHEGF
ncbi:hypothetical protein GF312_20185 [Candidatus Poribacteria bacterium]|nr:hypothetical protein [Candidatus Poribacteria bacterium]